MALAEGLKDAVVGCGGLGFFHGCQSQKALRLRKGRRWLAAMDAGEPLGGAEVEYIVEDGAEDEEREEDGGDCESVGGHCESYAGDERADWNTSGTREEGG